MGLFGKSDAARIAETIKFIEDTSVDSWERRKLVARGLKDWVEKQKAMGGNRLDLTSAAMSQKGGSDASTPSRGFRRALILIRTGLFGEDIAICTQAVAQLAANSLADEFKRTIVAAHKHLYANTQSNLNPLMDQLKTAPERFLSEIYTVTRVKGAAEKMEFIFFFDGKSYQLTPYAFEANNTFVNSSSVFYGQPAKIFAFNLPGKKWTDPGFSFDAIPGHDIPDDCTLMVTTQFSGCSFCFQKVNDTYRIAHVDPAKAISGQELARRCKAGRFDGLDKGGFRVYGMDGPDVGDRHLAYFQAPMYIFGVKTDKWRFYSQHNNTDQSRVGVYQIRENLPARARFGTM